MNIQPSIDHISVCICTFKRPGLLVRLLNELQKQTTENLFTYSIVVVDNDKVRSAEETVQTFNEGTTIDIRYCNEPRQNIALARNHAVLNAQGNFLAFIDDDEFPKHDWLLHMYRTHKAYSADGVLGPVKPHFETEPPQWVTRGKLCERKSFATGFIIKNPAHTRTGNVLLVKEIFNTSKNLFNPEFGEIGGEDVDFFKRMMAKGRSFVWCDEAIAYESVPAERFQRGYFLKRALLRGTINARNPNLKSIGKSIFVSVLYTATLPFLLLIGQHLFMKYLIKDCDHIGKLLGVCGIDIVKDRDNL